MSVYQKWNQTAQRWDYYIDYRHQGRRIREKIRPNKTLAQTVLRKRLVQIAEGQFLAKPRQIQTRLEEMIRLYVDNYAKPSKRSWKDDERLLKGFKRYFGNINLAEITPLRIESYRADRKSKVKDSTINREVTALKGMFSKALIWGKASENPAKKVKLFKENNSRTRFLEKGDIAGLLAACSDWLRPIVIVALNTGMRKGEILALAWDDVDFQNKLVRVRDSKNKEARTIDMSLALIETLRGLPQHQDSPYVFPDRHGEKSDIFGRVRGQFERALTAAKIKDFRFHDLRHTFASHLAMQGVDLFTIGAFLGHKSGYRMTQRYAHLSPQHRQKAIRALDGLTGAIRVDTQVDTWAENGRMREAEAFAKISADNYQKSDSGWVAERSKATVCKTVGLRPSKVRILPLPPLSGRVAEWLKAQTWKVCILLKGIKG